MQIRRTAAALTSAAALSVTGIAMATPAHAAPVFTGGLINVGVNVEDVDVLRESLNNNEVRILNNVLNDNEVNLGIAAVVIATVCDTSVGVLTTLIDTGSASCPVTGGTIDFSQAS